MQTFAASLLSALLLALPGAAPAPTGDGPDAPPADRGWLGVAIQDMTPRLARTMELTTREGALVSEVMEDSPAAQAGLRDKDIIVEFDGKPVTDADQLRIAVGTTAPGATVPVVVVRKDARTRLTVTLGKRKPDDVAAPPPPRVRDLTILRGGRPPLGMKLLTLNDQLGAYFRAPENTGVLVEEVIQGSEAATAGMKAGDVIVKAGRRTVEEVYDVRRAVARAKEGEKLPFEIIRNGSRQTITLTVPDRTPEGKGGAYWFRNDPGSDETLEFEFEMPDLAPELNDLRRELQELNGLQGKLKRELRRGGDEHRSILRNLHVEGGAALL